MKNLAKSTIALIAAGLVIAALAGALIATSLGGDDDDRDDDDRIALQTNEIAPASTGSGVTGGAAVDADGPDVDDVVVDADDVPLSKTEADRVAKAARDAVGGGTVTEVSRSDDPGEAYEVEVLTGTGEVDIALDADLNRVSNNPYDD